MMKSNRARRSQGTTLSQGAIRSRNTWRSLQQKEKKEEKEEKETNTTRFIDIRNQENKQMHALNTYK
jgi:hypothetical protein